MGKAMVVSIDKATAVRMYDKVRAHWHAYIDDLRGELPMAEEGGAGAPAGRDRLHDETDMAVVVSQAQNEVADMPQKGLDILPHRRRMVHEDLDDEVQGPRRPVPARVRLRHVDDRLRRASRARPSTSTSRCGTTP